MTPEQLSEERRRGRIAAFAAIVSGLAFVGGAIWYQAVNADRPDGDSRDAAILRYFDDHGGEYLASSILQAFGILLLAVVAVHLYRAAKARNPDQQPVVLVVGVYGPAAFAASTLLRAIVYMVIAGDFADRAPQAQTERAADDLLDTPVLDVANILGLTGVLALGFWLVKGSLDAMRIGLLTRFMGVLGIALGPALILGFGLVVLPLWLIALGVLFMGRWPRGTPPAWTTGRAVPWPSGAEARQGSPLPEEDADGGRNGEVDAIGPGVRKPGAGAERDPDER
jgi:hypothetical protein